MWKIKKHNTGVQISDKGLSVITDRKLANLVTKAIIQNRIALGNGEKIAIPGTEIIVQMVTALTNEELKNKKS